MTENITLISGNRRIECSNPTYYAWRTSAKLTKNHVPSHLVAWPADKCEIAEICYVGLVRGRVPVLVTHQPDGSVWLGGAYLDTIASELMLIPQPLPSDMKKKTEEWLKAVGDRWQLPNQSK